MPNNIKILLVLRKADHTPSWNHSPQISSECNTGRVNQYNTINLLGISFQGKSSPERINQKTSRSPLQTLYNHVKLTE